MSTFISAVQTLMLDISLLSALQVVIGSISIVALLMLFKPLLRGIVRALILVVKPKLSKEERLHRRQMRDAVMLKRMLNSLDGAPSHIAELRAMAARA